MKLGLAIVAALALSACISIDASGKYKALKPGASRVEVMKAMDGCPGTDLKRGRYEAMTYPGKMPFFFQLAPATYTFVFKDSALVAFGEGTAVEGGTPQEPTITFNPLSFKLRAWAWPWEPNPSTARVLPLSTYRSASLSL